MRALSIGATGMMAQQLNVETISNNIANMSTAGYKRERAEFQDLLYQQERRVGSPTSDNTIVTPDGYPVQPNIVVPANAIDVTISNAGEVFAYFDGQVAPQNLGQLELATFVNTNGLEQMGNSLMKE